MDDRSPNINGCLRTNHICNGVRLCSEPAVIMKAIARADALRLGSLVAVSLTKEISYQLPSGSSYVKQAINTCVSLKKCSMLDSVSRQSQAPYRCSWIKFYESSAFSLDLALFKATEAAKPTNKAITTRGIATNSPSMVM